MDVRLYLNQDWVKDKKRRKKCGVPREIRFRTRHALALEMLAEHGTILPHAWIAGDDEMGRSSAFRRELRGLGEQYLLAVPSNTLVRDLTLNRHRTVAVAAIHRFRSCASMAGVRRCPKKLG